MELALYQKAIDVVYQVQTLLLGVIVGLLRFGVNGPELYK